MFNPTSFSKAPQSTLGHVFRCCMAILIGVVAVSNLTGCAASPKIRSNTDPSADFNSYKTFGFMAHGDQKAYTSFLNQHLESAIASQMEQRGFVRADSTPDLLINYQVLTQDKVSVSQTPSTYYGYRGGMYGWGAGMAYDTSVYNYTEGTLNIDVVERAGSKLLWEGIAVGQVSQKAMDNLKPAVEKVVAATFKKFPKPPVAAP